MIGHNSVLQWNMPQNSTIFYSTHTITYSQHLPMSLLVRSRRSRPCSRVISSGRLFTLLSRSSNKLRALKCFKWSASNISIWLFPQWSSLIYINSLLLAFLKQSQLILPHQWYQFTLSVLQQGSLGRKCNLLCLK